MYLFLLQGYKKLILLNWKAKLRKAQNFFGDYYDEVKNALYDAISDHQRKI